MAHGQARRHREAAEAPEVGLRSLVLDSSALDALLDERIRRVVVQAARDGHAQLVVPATAVIEFVVGHPSQLARAARVLNAISQLSVTPELGARAARLLLGSASSTGPLPSVTDATVAALGESYGAVVTADVGDMEMLSAAGIGFEIYGVSDLLRAMGIR